LTAPHVSVLMTAYNRERFIGAAIESVLGQTYGDFELLVVDDASTDGTADVARRYTELDSRVRVTLNARNVGDYGNRNRAAALARAPLLKYHDSDDLMYPHCLQVMVAMLTAAPSAAFGLSASLAWPGGPCPMLLTPRMAYQREYLGGGLFYCGPGGAIFRTASFRELGGFDDRGVLSDYLFWLRACTRVNVVLMPADLFWYREHPGQSFRSAAADLDYARTAGEAWRALDGPECPLTPEEREQAKRNRAYHLAKRTLEDLRSGRWSFAARRLRHSGMGAWDWMRYLRRPRRMPDAGMPLQPDRGASAAPAMLEAARPDHAG
jgi:glycosyltransferase involved in cell wall biosynthesis